MVSEINNFKIKDLLGAINAISIFAWLHFSLECTGGSADNMGLNY